MHWVLLGTALAGLSVLPYWFVIALDWRLRKKALQR